MRINLLLTTLLGISACAIQHPYFDRQEVEDFISVRGLEEIEYIVTSTNSFTDVSRQLNDYHLRYQSRQNWYLIAFAQRCPDRSGTVSTDVRTNIILRARADSIRGCRIGRIYRMNKDDVAELRELGKPPAVSS